MMLQMAFNFVMADGLLVSYNLVSLPGTSCFAKTVAAEIRVDT